jgi:hypothetical protein
MLMCRQVRGASRIFESKTHQSQQVDINFSCSDGDDEDLMKLLKLFMRALKSSSCKLLSFSTFLTLLPNESPKSFQMLNKRELTYQLSPVQAITTWF